MAPAIATGVAGTGCPPVVDPLGVGLLPVDPVGAASLPVEVDTLLIDPLGVEPPLVVAPLGVEPLLLVDTLAGVDVWPADEVVTVAAW